MSEEIVRVGKKYTLVIPKKVRKTLGLKEGDALKIRVEGDQMILEKLEDPFEVLEKVIGVPYDETYDEKKAEEWLKKQCQ